MNQDLFNHLDTIAKLKALSGANHFSVASYERAAKFVRDATHDVSVEDISAAEGVGIKIAKTVDEFVHSGTSSTYKELAAKLPVECLSMTIVQGVGAKKAHKLWQLGIKNFDQLVKRAEANKLADIVAAKIGISNETAFKQAVIFAKDTAGRLPYETAMNVARLVLDALRPAGLDWASNIEVLGSLRRKQTTIKDIDIGACTVHANAFKEIISLFKKAKLDYEVVNQGDTKASFRIRTPYATMACDVWLVQKWYWGSFLNYATGNKQHNIRLRALAQRKGMTVSEYGIFKVGTENETPKGTDKNTGLLVDKKGRVVFVRGMGQRLGGEHEQDLYKLLGLEYVEPENRSE